MSYINKVSLAFCFVICLAVLGFGAFVQAQDALTPQERFIQMEAKAKAQREAFEAKRLEQKHIFEAKKADMQADIHEQKTLIRQSVHERVSDMQQHIDMTKEEFEALSDEEKAALRKQMEKRKQELHEKITDRKAELREKVQQRKAALQAKQQKRIANLAANVSNKMEAAIARIRQIIGRFQKRMDMLADRGVDTGDAQRALDEARTHLDQAQALIADIDILIAEVVGSESPRTAWQKAKNRYMEIRQHIKAAHTALRTSLQLLKEAVHQAQETRTAPAHTETQEAALSDTPEAPSN